MANFDANRWYQLEVQSRGTGQSMDGSVLFQQGIIGSVFFTTTNTSNQQQQWQLFPFNTSVHVLRSKGSGPQGYLGVSASANETTPGGTVPEMRNASVSDASMFWNIGTWTDGTFFLTNAANGSAWHLDVKPNALMSMSSNITAPQEGQSFSFNALDEINDARFSSVVTPSATAMPTAATSHSAGSTTNAPSSASTSSSSSTSGSKGLSAGASAAIGASVGGVALIALIILGYYILRRRKIHSPEYSKAETVAPQEPYYPYASEPQQPKEPLAELHSEQYSAAELHGEGYRSAELPGEVYRASELPGDVSTTKD